MSKIYIDETNRDYVRLYSEKKETKLVHANEPHPGYFITESINVTRRALDAGYVPESFFIDEESINDEVEKIFDSYANVPQYICSRSELESITGYPMTRGLLSCMIRREDISVEELVKDKKRIAVLANVENPTNVGALFRSAAALNMQAVVLSKGCADVIYRRTTRVSMGTVFQIPWTYVHKLDETNLISLLRKEGYKCVAMALRDNTINIDDEILKKEDKLAIVLGSEGYGLPNEAIAQCDYTVMIPMAHGVDSLNVSTAGAIAFYELGKHIEIIKNNSYNE